MVEMPVVPLNCILPHITEDEFKLVQACLRQGRLKASQPNVKYKYVQSGSLRIKRPEEQSGQVAYLWRAIAYHISPYKRDLACPPDYRMFLTDKNTAERLNEIAEIVCKNVPKAYHYGLVARGVL
jgi:hypothetical protein